MARGVWRWCSSVPEYFIIHQIFSIETKYFTWKTFTGGNPREVRLFLLAANCDSTSHWMIELLQVRSSESFYLIAVTNGLISCFRRDYFASWHWGNLSMSRLSPEQSCEPKSGLGPGRQAERERERERQSLLNSRQSNITQLGQSPGGGRSGSDWDRANMNIRVLFNIPSGALWLWRIEGLTVAAVTRQNS